MMENKNNGKNEKTALITGVTSGIGKELSYLFAQDGYNLVLVARNQNKLDALEKDIRQKYRVKVTGIIKDLSDTAAPDEIFSELEQSKINIDVLVNNAGYNVYGPFHQTDYQEQQKLIQVILNTPTHLTRLFLPGMVKRGSGRIMFVGSTASFMPVVNSAVYGGCKAYILSSARALSQELLNTGVTVTCLCPGATRTEFAEKAGMTKTRLFNFGLMESRTVAEIGYKAFMNGKRVAVPGLFNRIQVFSVRLTPMKIIERISRFVMSEK